MGPRWAPLVGGHTLGWGLGGGAGILAINLVIVGQSPVVDDHLLIVGTNKYSNRLIHLSAAMSSLPFIQKEAKYFL